MDFLQNSSIFDFKKKIQNFKDPESLDSFGIFSIQILKIPDLWTLLGSFTCKIQRARDLWALGLKCPSLDILLRKKLEAIKKKDEEEYEEALSALDRLLFFG